VLQWYYRGVTVVLQRCYRGITVVLQCCYRGVAVVLHLASNPKFQTNKDRVCVRENGVTVVLQW
jgi:hypothetical protein